jgi:hypothetical protein
LMVELRGQPVIQGFATPVSDVMDLPIRSTDAGNSLDGGQAIVGQLRQRPVERQKGPGLRGLCEERMMGLEPTTFCMASRRSSQLSYIRASPAV